jgi:prophage maintenance system killer protein
VIFYDFAIGVARGDRTRLAARRRAQPHLESDLALKVLSEYLQRNEHRRPVKESGDYVQKKKAAALGFSLVSNHPFIDGDKCIGHKSLETFLALNDQEISAPIDDTEQTVLRLAVGNLSRAEWTNWVQTHIVEFHA